MLIDRREMFGVLGATGLAAMATGAVAASAGAFTADDPPATIHIHDKNKSHMACLEACGHCSAVCNEMSMHCLSMLAAGQGDLKYHAKAHALAMDCAAFCSLSATMIARNSDLMIDSCTACAAACKACAEECEKSSMAPMKECAKACRACEASCLAMVEHMKGTSEPAPALKR